MDSNFCSLIKGDAPLIAAAIHDGHAVREELDAYFALNELERLREEDPFTGAWTEVAATRIVGRRSRFEVDLNRPREKAVYLAPEDAWGLQVWNGELPAGMVAQSRDEYDAFYAEVRHLFADFRQRFGRFIVYDLHSYNHRRGGPDAPFGDPAENPEVNIGTGTMEREYWAPVIERFIDDLRCFDFLGRHLDVRENVKFRGGYFPHWGHEMFPESACVLAIEFKKFFMNEWTGAPDREQLQAIQGALRSTVPGVLEELAKL